MLSGSVAMSVYVLPRSTRDIDIVVHLLEKDISTLVEYFNEGFYCDEDAVREAIRRKSLFNIIDHKSGFKADFVVLKNELYRQTEFQRRRRSDFFGTPIFIVSAEDLLISKLIWIQELSSSVQKDDITALAKVEDMDWKYIRKWVKDLKLNTFDLFPSS
jgi:hypothetical protein